MSGKQRKHYSAEEKVAILRLHLLEKRPVSEVCDQHGLNPTVFYRWQKEFFEQGHLAFTREDKQQAKADRERLERLESKLAHKDGVLAELMSEYVALKKKLGLI